MASNNSKQALKITSVSRRDSRISRRRRRSTLMKKKRKKGRRLRMRFSDTLVSIRSMKKSLMTLNHRLRLLSQRRKSIQLQLSNRKSLSSLRSQRYYHKSLWLRNHRKSLSQRCRHLCPNQSNRRPWSSQRRRYLCWSRRVRLHWSRPSSLHHKSN